MGSYDRSRNLYPHRNMRTDVSFGARHPISRDESGANTDTYGQLLDFVAHVGSEYFGNPISTSNDQPVGTDIQPDGSFIVMPVEGGSSGLYGKPFSILKPNGIPAIAVLHRHKTADKRNRRIYGWTDRDLLRARGDIEQNLGRLMFHDTKSVEFDDVIVQPIDKTKGEGVAKIALIPASPWLEFFKHERDVVHLSTFRGNGRVCELPEDEVPHLNVVRMSREVTTDDVQGFKEQLKLLTPVTLSVEPLEFYDNTIIRLH